MLPSVLSTYMTFCVTAEGNAKFVEELYIRRDSRLAKYVPSAIRSLDHLVHVSRLIKVTHTMEYGISVLDVEGAGCCLVGRRYT